MKYEDLLNSHLEAYQDQYNHAFINLHSNDNNSNLTTEKRLNL
jgi:trehalose/maltose hydrolase-like predicted phosphorylase